VPNLEKNQLSRFSPPLIVYGIIFFLSSRPASAFPKIAPDIVPHFIEYTALGYFFIRMVCFKSPVTVKPALLSLPPLLLLAFLDELHQYYVPTRHFQVKDLLVDSVGIAAGIVFFIYISGRARAKRIRG
jgi:VanZ family protein